MPKAFLWKRHRFGKKALDTFRCTPFWFTTGAILKTSVFSDLTISLLYHLNENWIKSIDDKISTNIRF